MTIAEREPRKAVELEVQLKDFKFTEITAENASNLSSGGAFIRMDTPHKEGTLIKFEIKVSQTQTISGVGRVVWFREEEDDKGQPGVGVKFVKLSAESKTILENVLDAAEEAPVASPPPEPEPEPEQDTEPEPEPEPEPQSEPEPAPKPAPEPEPEPEPKSEPEPEPETKPATDVAPETPSTVAGAFDVKTPASSGSPTLLWVILIGAIVGAVALLVMKRPAEPPETAPVEDVAVATPPADTPAAPEPAPPAAPAAKPTPAATENTAPAPADTPDQAPATAADEAADTAQDEAKGTDAPTPADESAAPKPDNGTAAEPQAAPATAGDAALRVKSAPAGATVIVNGQVRERVTPMTLKNLATGKEIEITLKKAGYITTTQTYTPDKPKNAVAISLPAARIKFRLTSTPPGARILIDGKFNGKTPYTFLRRRYKPGYQYKLEKRGFEPVEGTVKQEDWVEEDGRYYVFSLDATLSPKASEESEDTGKKGE